MKKTQDVSKSNINHRSLLTKRLGSVDHGNLRGPPLQMSPFPPGNNRPYTRIIIYASLSLNEALLISWAVFPWHWAAKESLRTLGYDSLHVAIRGGASFTHEWRNRNFLSLLKDIWFQEHKYSSVTLVWAGNDLTNYWSTPESLTHAVEVRAFGQRYGVPIRLVDVVGERYQCR